MPESQAQVRMARAVLAGKSTAMPMKVAREIVAKMHGRKMSSLPERKYPYISSMLEKKKRKAA